MFDDSSNTGAVSFNAQPPPIQQDDRSVNPTRGETRDRSKFQKLLKEKNQVEGDQEGEEELAAESKSNLNIQGRSKPKAQTSLDLALGDTGKDDLLALIKDVDERDKSKQGLGVAAEGTTTGAFAAGASGQNIAIAGVSGEDDSGAGFAAVKDSESAKRMEMWEMLEKLVDTITAMKSDGKTEITVTLKEPPLFQGAQVKVEEFDQAKGQFNIAFQNLSPEAKMMLDQQGNRENLKRALEERGYMLHIMTTNLEVEKPKVAEAQSSPFYQQDRGGQQQQKQQQQKQKDDFDE